MCCYDANLYLFVKDYLEIKKQIRDKNFENHVKKLFRKEIQIWNNTIRNKNY